MSFRVFGGNYDSSHFRALAARSIFAKFLSSISFCSRDMRWFAIMGAPYGGMLSKLPSGANMQAYVSFFTRVVAMSPF
jgi:hypothetical protein